MSKKKITIIILTLFLFVFSSIYLVISQNAKKININDNFQNNNVSFEEKEYDFSKPLAEKELISVDYFNDAVFVGDSRTEGFRGMTSLNSTFYTHIGLSVASLFTENVINFNGQKLTVLEALKNTNFNKIYIMLGINETGWQYSNLFIEKYQEFIDEIKKINPNAIIYIESILPVSKDVSINHEYIKREKIEEYNLLLQKLAKEEKVYYLDIYSSLLNDERYLPDEASVDGIHLNKEYSLKWLNYLQTHYILEDDLRGENVE